MIATIHQPEHIPWIGFFDKMKKAEVYVVLDNVQFTKNNYQNRNRVFCTNKDWDWLTAPVSLNSHLDSKILDIPLAPEWTTKYWNKLVNSYQHHPFFGLYKDELKEIVFSDNKMLLSLNMQFIEFFRTHLDIKTPLILASTLSATGKRSELLANICKEIGASTYLSGPSGRDYLDFSFFQKENIEVIFHSYKPKPYPSKKFVPYLSTLDLLFNVGPDAKDHFQDA